MKARIALVSPFHLANNIRLVKEANALADAGYQVDVFAGRYLAWAEAGDATLQQGSRWRAHFTSYGQLRHPALFWYSRVRRKIACTLWPLLKPHVSPAINDALALRALDRVLPEMRAKVVRHQADLYIGHGTQSLPIVVRAARQNRSFAGYDAEDFHLGMRHLSGLVGCDEELVAFVESHYIREIQHLTAASPGVAAALRKRYPGVEPVPVLNVFPLSERPVAGPGVRPVGPLRLYWFSQTIGRDRGLEEAVRACGLLPKNSVELHLRGNWQAGYESELATLWTQSVGHRAKLVVHEVLPPGQLVRAAAEYDVGLALEVPVSENRMICMTDLCTNKVFTYLMAGLALAASALKDGAVVFEGAGFSYPSGNAAELAAGLQRWLDDPAALQRAKNKAWKLASVRYNWEFEQKAFLSEIERVLAARPV